MPSVRYKMSARTATFVNLFLNGAAKEKFFDAAIQYGTEYMWMPADDFARITHATSWSLSVGPSSMFQSAEQRLKFLTMEGDQMPEDEHWTEVRDDIYRRSVEVLRSHEMDFTDGWTVALRFGLVLIGCRYKALKTATKNYGKPRKVPTKLLNDNKTYGGQAHIGGTGPEWARCHQCQHFDPKANFRGPATQGRCGAWAELLGVKIKNAPLIPSAALTCKYFEERPNEN